MKGVGNYRFSPSQKGRESVERKVGVLVSVRGQRAVVQFSDGTAYAMPAALLLAAGIQVGFRFSMVVKRRGKKVVDVLVAPIAQARPPLSPRGQPKVMVRSGRKMVTRKSR